MELDESAQRAAKRHMLRQSFGLDVKSFGGLAAFAGLSLVEQSAWPWDVRARHRQLCARQSCARSNDGLFADHPLLRETFDALEARARALSIVPFDERSGTGDLRYVWAKTNGRQVILTLVTAEVESRAAEQLAQFTRIDVDTGLDLVAGVTQRSGGAGKQHARRGPVPAQGRGRADDGACSGSRSPPVLGFLQPNPEVAELAYRCLVEAEGAAREPSTDVEHRPPKRDLAFDLYAGAGAHHGRSAARLHAGGAVHTPESAERRGRGQDADFGQAVVQGARPDS